MASGRGHCPTLPSLQGPFSLLTAWECGPQSGGWLQMAAKGWWILSKLPEYSAPKTQTTAPRFMHTLLIYPPTLCISITFMTSLNDIMIVHFPLSMGKALHMCRTAMPVHLHIHQHLCQLFSTATHEPSHQFCIPNFEPVTHIFKHIYTWMHACK